VVACTEEPLFDAVPDRERVGPDEVLRAVDSPLVVRSENEVRVGDDGIRLDVEPVIQFRPVVDPRISGEEARSGFQRRVVVFGFGRGVRPLLAEANVTERRRPRTVPTPMTEFG